jgi:hypothetical protein
MRELARLEKKFAKSLLPLPMNGRERVFMERLDDVKPTRRIEPRCPPPIPRAGPFAFHRGADAALERVEREMRWLW